MDLGHLHLIKSRLMGGLGLTEIEAEAYIFLLESRGQEASAVARRLGLGRPKAYELLARLVVRGLIIEIKEGASRYYPVQPDLVFEQIRGEQQAAWERQDNRLQGQVAELMEVYHESGSVQTSPETVRIWSGRAWRVRRDVLQAGTRSFYWAQVLAPVAGWAPETALVQVRELAVRGVEVRLLVEAEVIESAVMQAALAGERAPYQVRSLRHLPFRVELFDRRQALVALPPGGERGDELRFEEYSQVVVIDLIGQQFERLWQAAEIVPLPLAPGWRPGWAPAPEPGFAPTRPPAGRRPRGRRLGRAS